MSSIVEKIKSFWSPDDADYEGYDEYEYGYDDDSYSGGAPVDVEDERNVYSNNRQTARKPARETSRERSSDYEDPYGTSKVVNIHATAKLQVVVFKPDRFSEETAQIADELMKMHTVVLNLEDCNRDMIRRIIDFLSGVAYANKGRITRIATNTFIILPNNVDITGADLVGELENNGIIFA